MRSPHWRWAGRAEMAAGVSLLEHDRRSNDMRFLFARYSVDALGLAPAK
jgi:hypothetical protein